MKKLNIVFILISFLYFTTPSLCQIKTSWNTDTIFYSYTTDANVEYLIRERINFEKNFDKKKILDSIASYLTNTYFLAKNKYDEGKRKISIDVQKVTAINLPENTIFIATVNIDDPDKICMGTYFQGSTGGYFTFLILVSNLMQPQLKTPLLDGVIFLYNDAELKLMDHINLKGLISEREIDNIVERHLIFGQ